MTKDGEQGGNRLTLLTVRLFGPFNVRLRNLPLPHLHRREGERLLAYLTLHHGTPVTYRALAQIFWPSEARVNRGLSGDFPNTRQAIRTLRQTLDTEAWRLTSPGKGIVSLDLTGADVDVVAFDRLTPQEDAAAWREAVEWYRAPLLEGWTDAWALEAQKRRQASYERVLRRLVESAEADGDRAQVEQYLRRGALATTSEVWTRDLAQLLAEQGRFSEAEEAFAFLDTRLRTQGQCLSGETLQLRALLQRERDGGSPRRATVEETPVVLAASPEPNLAEPAPDAPLVVIVYKRSAQQDETVMRLLERTLMAAGYRIFVDRYISAGIEWAAEIEKQIRTASAVITLLSALSVRSEMLEHEVVVADAAAQKQNGLPRLLPVRVDFTDPLPDGTALATILNPLHCAFWHSADDDADLVRSIRLALEAPPVLPPDTIRLEPSGGAVALDSRFYIVRDTDHEFMAAARRPDSIVLVKGARQMGKTSLLARGLQQARAAGARVALTDLQTLHAAQLETPEALFHALAAALALQLDLDVSVNQTWDPYLSANMNMEMFLRRQVLSKFPQGFVWGMDEVDRLFTCSFGSEVFALFRSWHNRRSLEPDGPWARLTLAIAYATEAHLFITDANQSPFNVGTRVALDDFTEAQVGELNHRYGAPLSDANALSRFFNLVHGQPYLTRRGLDEMTLRGLNIDRLEGLADRDDGPFGDHLRRLLALLARDAEMSEVLRGALRGGACPDPDSFYRLRSAGLMAGEWGLVMRLRCRIYEAYLARHLL